MENDLAKAREIQQHMLPAEAPDLDGVDIAGFCQPADACGGDFYDCILLPSGKCDLVVDDVSSHGFGPALIMVGTRRLLRTCAPMHDDLGQVVTIANQAVHEDTLPEQFVSMFYCRLDPSSGQLSFASAGHSACVIKADGSATTLQTKDLLLGLLPSNTYEMIDGEPLQQGEILLLMTDGAFEVQSSDNELFGQQRVIDLIHQHRDKPAASIIDVVLEEITNFGKSRALKMTSLLSW
ncbi:MAG: hypothetical protein CMJ78_01890 [Planctomycetaceae bacterium]|nr:hypothetical protein [Planctomycetaceae bacterium]